jgi:hypothetical protein
MISELDSLIDDSLRLKSDLQRMQERYDANRNRIFDLMSSANQKVYQHSGCKVVRTEQVSFETVSKDLLAKALQEVDIPREKKVFIWNRAIKQMLRPAMVVLQAHRNPTGGPFKTAYSNPNLTAQAPL